MGKIKGLSERRDARLIHARQRTYLACFAVIFIILLLFPAGKIRGSDFGILLGQVRDTSHNFLTGIKVDIISKEQDFQQALLTQDRGFFQICGLPFGTYNLVFEGQGYQTQIMSEIAIEPSRILFLKVALASANSKETAPRPILIDFTNFSSQTIINQSQIQNLPSGNNVWSLIENQDLSATVNRIDVGGLWADIPALYSSRGSISWTQSIYLLNGLDVTDPYQTGLPLFYPDFFSLRFSQLRNGQFLPQSLSPGGTFDLIPKEGGPQYHGSLSAYYTDKNFTTKNITPALEKEGLFESHSFGHFRNFNAQASGPLLPGKLFFFSSLTNLDLGRDLAGFPEEDKSAIYSGLVNLKYLFGRSSLTFLWTGQIVHYPSNGAERNIPFSSTLDQKNLYNVFQGIWEARPRNNHFFRVGLSFSRGDFHSQFQKGTAAPHGLEIFQNIPSGPAASSDRGDRNSLVFFAKGESLVGNMSSAHHRIDYGLELRYSTSSSETEIIDNLHLHFFKGKPLEIIKYNTPVEHKESTRQLAVFAQETLTLSNLISFSVGFHLASSEGWIPLSSAVSAKADKTLAASTAPSKISWLNLSPRLSLSFPLSQRKTSFLRLSAGRYYFTLPLNLLAWGNPNSLGGVAYAWQDKNNDRRFQEDEAGTLLRREGPFFSRIDLGLRRPYTDEFSAEIVHSLGADWIFCLVGFYRETRDLIGTANIGVPVSAYDPLKIYDNGDDRIPATPDDLVFTVYNQKKEFLGKDFFLLTNPDFPKRVSRYKGLDLTVVKKFSSQSGFFLSLTATEAWATTNPGNTEWENDDGVIGALYDNPNTLINAHGRPCFDRAYTGRIGFHFPLFLGFRLAGIIKYYDGQPFARKIIVTGLDQGPFYIQAHPRGVSRYEYNMTVDLRVEKIIALGTTKLRLICDGFNIFNQNLATEENEWTGSEYPLRFATEVQSPRVFRLGLSYEF